PDIAIRERAGNAVFLTVGACGAMVAWIRGRARRSAVRGRWAALAFVTLGLLTGCAASVPTTGSATSSPSAPAASEAVVPASVEGQLTNIRLGILPISAFVDFYIAREYGWFQEEG